jgi:hypothetical protein
MKDKIRMILREGVVDNTIKRILIFDFDGTLIDTDTPESGKPLWLKEFGFEWPFTGWWGRPESLDSRIYFEKNKDKLSSDVYDKGMSKNIFDNAVISSTVSDYDNETTSEIDGKKVKRSDTLTILLTGRHSGVGDLVGKILKMRSLTFDEYIYKTGNKETDEFKKDILNQLVNKYPDLQEMQIWEDRDDHLPIFQSWANQQSFNVIVHHVTDATK